MRYLLLAFLFPLTVFADGKITNADIYSGAAVLFSKMKSTTASRAAVTNSYGFMEASPVTSTEVSYLSGTTGSIQAQLNAKQTGISIGALDAQAANANGLALSSSILSTQSADATHPGVVNNTTQTMSGDKTFTGLLTGGHVTASAGDTTTPSFYVPTGGGNTGFFFGAGGGTFSYNGGDIASFVGTQWKMNVQTNLFVTSNANTPALYLLGEDHTGLYRIGANNLGFSVSSAKVLDISSTGLGVTGNVNISGLTVSRPVATDSSDNLVSSPITGTGTTVVLATGPTMTNPAVGTQSIGDNSTLAASTAFVQSALAQLNPAAAVYAASTANIAGTYVNAVSGICIGDTFTTTALALFTLDGASPPIGARVLFKDQTSGFQNGIWTLTTQGVVGISGAILTRALDWDSSPDMNAGNLVPVINGATNANTVWFQSATVTTCNSDSEVFTKFSGSGGTVTSVAASVPAFLSIAGSPITTSGTLAISLSGTALPVANGGTGATSLAQNGVIYGGGTSALSATAAGAAGAMFSGNGATSPPIFTTASYPHTVTSGSVMVSTATNVWKQITGLDGQVLGMNNGAPVYQAKATSASIAALDIDWSKADFFTKTITGNTVFTFSGKTAGQTIVVRVTNTGNFTATFPTANVLWPAQTTPTMTTGSKSDVYTFIFDGLTTFASAVQNF